MNMKKLFIYILITTCFYSCRKFKACFTVDKPTANVGDTIAFYNCSDNKRADMNATLKFGDGESVTLKRDEQITHIYKSIGEYEVTLTVGSNDYYAYQTQTITVK